jgi:FkbM family methyltransferase
MASRLLHTLGRALRKVGAELVARNALRGTWIDVGAHNGETTLGLANHNPGLKIYALEPNLAAVSRVIGRAPNFIVFPFAVGESDGHAELQINAHETASSLLPLSADGVREWIGGDQLRVVSRMTVPTIRLDTFMNLMEIESVDLLKVDTQGMDLAVVRSAGSRLGDIRKIVLEVSVAPLPAYTGAATKEEVVAFLGQAGFALRGSELQTHDQEENLTFEKI